MYSQLIKPKRLRYEDAKAVITHTRADGKLLSKVTTWRADLIESILKGGNCLNAVSVGAKITIEVEINSISGPDKSEEVPKSFTEMLYDLLFIKHL